MIQDVLIRMKKRRSYCGRIALIAVFWGLLDYLVAPYAIAWRSTDGDSFFPILTQVQFPLFAPFLILGFAAGLAVLRCRKRSSLGTFYASSVARIVARWSACLSLGVLTYVVSVVWFCDGAATARLADFISPITEIPIAFASLFTAAALLCKGKTGHDSVLQSALTRRTSARILFVLIGYLLIGVGGKALGCDFDSLVYTGWGYLSSAFLSLAVVSAFRARRRRGVPRAILYSGASRIYLCYCVASALSFPSLWLYVWLCDFCS